MNSKFKLIDCILYGRELLILVCVLVFCVLALASENVYSRQQQQSQVDHVHLRNTAPCFTTRTIEWTNVRFIIDLSANKISWLSVERAIKHYLFYVWTLTKSHTLPYKKNAKRNFSIYRTNYDKMCVDFFEHLHVTLMSSTRHYSASTRWNVDLNFSRLTH